MRFFLGGPPLEPLLLGIFAGFGSVSCSESEPELSATAKTAAPAARAAAAAASFFFSALKAIPFAFEALDLARFSLIDASLAFYKSE